jgi:hypothetical protein
MALEQLSLIAKNSQKANLETIAYEEKGIIDGLDTLAISSMSGRTLKNNDREAQLKQTNNMSMDKEKFQALHETIVFEKADKVSYESSYGNNWVYAYDLPYDLSTDDALIFANAIEEEYGGIKSFRLFTYVSMVERSQK